MFRLISTRRRKFAGVLTVLALAALVSLSAFVAVASGAIVGPGNISVDSTGTVGVPGGNGGSTDPVTGTVVTFAVSTGAGDSITCYFTGPGGADYGALSATDPASFTALFPVGTTSVTCSDDGGGDSVTFTVTVTQPLAGACPPNGNFSIAPANGSRHDRNADGFLCQNPGGQVVVDNSH